MLVDPRRQISAVAAAAATVAVGVAAANVGLVSEGLLCENMERFHLPKALSIKSTGTAGQMVEAPHEGRKVSNGAH